MFILAQPTNYHHYLMKALNGIGRPPTKSIMISSQIHSEMGSGSGCKLVVAQLSIRILSSVDISINFHCKS